MTWETVLRFAAAYDTRHLVGDAVNAPALLVTSDALNKPKLNEPTPVVIDHDDDRVVDRVKNVYVWDDVDYGTRVRRWHFAACELDEKPDWLKRGSGVSWSYHPLHEYAGNQDTTVLTSCIIREVSLLSPARTPKEPLARVCYVKETPVTHRHPRAARPQEGEVVFGHGQMLRRPGLGKLIAVGGVRIQ